jgi:hypothetical protein
MKKIFISVLFLSLFTITNLFSQDEKKTTAKKAYPLNIHQGEIFNDMGEGVDVSLSEEYAVKEKGLTLKIVYKGGGSVGMWNPKVSNWSDFNFLKMVFYNPSQEIIKLNFAARDDSKVRDYSTRFDQNIILRPGKNEITIPIQGATNNSGNPFNLKKITHWFIWAPTAKADKPVTVYLCDIYLTTEE